MAHRIWKETKQQPGTVGTGNMLGCCLVSLPFPVGHPEQEHCTESILKHNLDFDVNRTLRTT